MKKMISKKLVSLLAAATMLLTSASVVFAANDYTSESGNQWGTAADVTGCAHVVSEDGVLTSTRTLFRNLGSGNYYGADSAGTAWIATEETSIPPASTTWDLEKEISTGKAQTKFDVKFDGGAGQTIYVYFAGYANNTGVRITKNAIHALIDGGGYGGVNYTLADGTWYTVTVTLDMDIKTMSYTVTDKAAATNIASGSRDFSSNLSTTGAVTGLTFVSPADKDHTNRNDVTVTATDGYPTSVWHIANVEYDAYTETNYEIDSVWRNTSGISINKETTYYNYQGMTLTRLTNFDDPANASFITAGYDEDNRMGNAVVTPLSSMGATPVNPNVGEYATVKSFIMDTKTATPFVSAYSYATPDKTKKWFDFESGYSAPAGDDGVTLTKVQDGADNNVLKIERSIFRNSSKNYSWVNDAWTEDTTTTFANKAQELQFGATAKEFELSFRLKFDGTENGAGRQAACIWLGELSGYPIGIRRAADGTVTLTHNNGNWASSVCKMNAGEWYDFTMAVTVNGTVNVAWTIEKGGKVIATASKDLASVSGVTTGYGKVNIGSRRDDDLIVTSTTEVSAANTKTTTSVWYIDDLAVKY